MDKSEKPKASENLAKDVETKPTPPIVMPRKQPEYYALTETLRQAIIEALLTSSPKKLSVGEVNKIHIDLIRLRPIHISETTNEKKT